MQLNVTKIERHTGGHLVAHLTLPGEDFESQYVFYADPTLDTAPVYQALAGAYNDGLLAAHIEDVVEPAPPVVVPASVTMRQWRLWLLGAGLLSQVSPLLDALPEPTKSVAIIEWEYATTVARDNDLVYQIAAALGKSPAETDLAFIEAAAL